MNILLIEGQDTPQSPVFGLIEEHILDINAGKQLS
jgi:hypothetical protein